MKKRQIAVCGGEREYTKKFAEFANSRKDSLFAVHGFTDCHELMAYTKEHSVDILLLSEKLLDQFPEQTAAGKVILLSEEEYREENGYPAVYKYQSCSQVLRQALNLYAEQARESAGIVLRTEGMKKVGVYSPVGRTGKTGFALAFGKETAKKYRTLYLNMEEYSGFTALYPYGDGWTLSELMYFLKQGKIQGQEFSIDLTEKNFLKYLKKGSLFCAGGIPEDFLKKAGDKGIQCFDYLKDPLTAMENTIATAEGAIAQAILRSPENLRGSICLVIGYGKCGRTLAGYLQNMFCRTMVWEKDREKAAQAKAAGLKILEERELPRALTLPAFLFQTAPCVVLKKDLLKYIRKDTCIIDIASLPGGLDYPAAKDLGLSPLHLPGIPGKYAPKASGEILASAAIRKLSESMQQEGLPWN